MPRDTAEADAGAAARTASPGRRRRGCALMGEALVQVHDLITAAALRDPQAVALRQRDRQMDYGELAAQCARFAGAAAALGLAPGDRVATFLPKQFETVIALFGSSAAGVSFVPVNPVLKPAQVAHIVNDCQVRVLVTSAQRWQSLAGTLSTQASLHTVILTDDDRGDPPPANAGVLSWSAFMDGGSAAAHRRIDRDMAAILYTSGSTGKPKGVVLSHGNLLAGAESVSSYLENVPGDRLLAVLPLSFDAGLSQLTTAFRVGASATLMDYLLPRDVLRAVERHAITGLAAVPPLWNQLVNLEWPQAAAATLRYITNTGGAMPVATTHRLRTLLPATRIYLMYGLTEAFRSTYLPPSEVDRIPESIGRAIPNADILVVDADGRECAPGEPGELVHRGNLVALGYWNNPEKTAQRFRPCPGQDPALPITELAVWSGDRVVKDADGYLYFVARQDEMIKTSGYRVSPAEVEEIAYGSGLVAGAAALGVPHPVLGQGILLVVTAADSWDEALAERLRAAYRTELPGFMQPLRIVHREALPHNQNGKIDRRALHAEYETIFSEDAP